MRQPEQLVPGIAQYYATAMNLAGTAVGLLVESHEGRPTKIEGNPSHPVSRGATDLFAQASVLGLYDPDRSQTPTRNGQITQLGRRSSGTAPALRELMRQGGKGVRILTEAVASPTLAATLGRLVERASAGPVGRVRAGPARSRRGRRPHRVRQAAASPL